MDGLHASLILEVFEVEVVTALLSIALSTGR